MGYAIPRIAKLKSTKDMSDAYNHNMRLFHVLNADPSRTKDNEDLVDELNGRSYQDMFDDQIRYMDMVGINKRKIRKDAVRGMEIMLSFSHEDLEGMDLEGWKKANVEWLEKMFNPPNNEIRYTDPETGEEVVEKVNNVKSVVVHNDETTPHIHAFVIPLDPRGQLNSHYYIGGRQKLVEMHDLYAEAMKPFGLERGEKHSVATHQQTSKYYNKLIEAVEAELPTPEKDEPVEDYRKRANDVYQTAKVHHRNEVVKLEQKIVKAESKATDSRIELAKERHSHRRTIKKLAKALDSEDRELTPELLRESERAITEHRRFEEAVEEYPDREMAMEAERLYREMVEWQRKREEHIRREEKAKKKR